MLARLASLRLWLLIAMIVSAAAGLVGAAFLFRQVENTHEAAGDRTQARQEARAIARQLQQGAGVARTAAMQAVLVNDQVIIEPWGTSYLPGAFEAGARV